MEAREPERFQILIVDDHPVVRQGLAHLLSQSRDLVSMEAVATTKEALNVASAHEPDAAVVDISLADEQNGLELIRALRRRGHTFPILVVSMHDEALYAERVVRAGGQGYLAKSEPPELLLAAIRSVLRGEIALSEAVRRRLRKNESGTGNTGLLESLTDRELQVLELVGRGGSTRAIALRLGVSGKTVETHRQRIRKKLRLSTSNEVLHYAIGFVEDQSRSGGV